MNKRGQALIEFILVMPILIMILLACFDLVQIFSVKIDLENQMEDLVIENKLPNNEVTFNKKDEEDFTIYKLSKKVDITSPLVTVFIDEDYNVVVERTLYNE